MKSGLQIIARLSLCAAFFLLGATPALAQAPDRREGFGQHVIDEIVVESTGLNQTLSDQAQPVTILTGHELDMKVQSSLGDTLAAEPGISSSSFGPGAGRPVIRGLGGDRIRVLENGVGTQDISATSPDHAVTIDSALVDKIEVVRGPASLLYGTSAVGGIVNVFDERIPEFLPKAPIQGSAEVRGESSNRLRSSLMSITAPIDAIAIHIDGSTSKSDDVDIPGFARTAQARDSGALEYSEPQGKLPFSATQTDTITAGGSYVFDRGFAGVAINDYKTIYGVPNGEEDVSVNAHRRRLDMRAGARNLEGFIESATVRGGIVDYDHTEFEGEDAGTKFKSNGFDSRLDIKHAEINYLRGTWGAQAQGNRLEAIGEEAFQPPSTTNSYSLFALEEFRAAESLSLQGGLRYDLSSVETTGFNSDSDVDDIDKNFGLFSQSVGAVWDVMSDYSISLSSAHTERAPTAQELFADGRHVATGVYEIGDAQLGVERSLGTDLAFRRNEGSVRGFVGGFYSRFWNYISANPTGEIQDDLPVYLFQNVPADFWGFESQVSWFMEECLHREISFDFQPDYVWARDRDTKEYIPRVPPLRIKIGANFFDERLARFRLELQHVFEQDRTAEYETSTDAYTMLNAYVSREFSYRGNTLELFVRGTNLLGEKARNHVSYIKDVAPLPGASAMAGIRMRF